MTLLNETNCTFTQSKGGLLSVEFEGKTYNRVSVIRAFPFTDPELYISVRDADMNEIGIIENLALLSEQTRRLIKSQIDIRYFTPKITAVHYAKDKAGEALIKCDTDKGYAEFRFKTGGDSVIRLGENRIIFTDIDGNRYEVPDVSALPTKHKKKLDIYI